MNAGDGMDVRMEITETEQMESTFAEDFSLPPSAFVEDGDDFLMDQSYSRATSPGTITGTGVVHSHTPAAYTRNTSQYKIFCYNIRITSSRFNI